MVGNINDWKGGNVPLSYQNALHNANIIFNEFSKFGMTKESICAMLGNMWEESTVNPQRTEVSVGWGYGLTQFTYNYAGGGIQKIKDKMKAYNIGGSYDNGYTQCEIIKVELTRPSDQWYDVSGYQTLEQFKASKDIEASVWAFGMCYERPADLSASINNRIKYANMFYKDITGDVPSGDGLQLAVLPIHYIHVTQSEFTPDFSHAGTEAVDMVGSHSRYPLYAPCDVVCMGVDRSEAFVIWQSQKEVRCVDGTTSFITFNIGHDDTHYQYNIGDTFKKGELFGHTGNSGHSFGDHLHIEVSKGKYTTNWSGGGIPNPTKLWYVFSSCDNVTKETFPIIEAGGIPWACDLNWKDGSGGTDPNGKNNFLIPFLMLNTLNGWYK